MSEISYERLLEIARKMHLYIFLHSDNEQEIYDELQKIIDYIWELEHRIEKAIEYITNNFADIDYMKSRYSEQVINTHIAEIPITDIEKLLYILK